jgi:hypothetical protein
LLSGPNRQEGRTDDLHVRVEDRRRDDAGSLRTSEANWQAGDIVIAERTRRYQVTAVIPLPTIGEFVDGATCGLLEVEPL